MLFLGYPFRIRGLKRKVVAAQPKGDHGGQPTFSIGSFGQKLTVDFSCNYGMLPSNQKYSGFDDRICQTLQLSFGPITFFEYRNQGKTETCFNLVPDAQRHFRIGAQNVSYRPKTPFF